jgi:hypothetical protein
MNVNEWICYYTEQHRRRDATRRGRKWTRYVKSGSAWTNRTDGGAGCSKGRIDRMGDELTIVEIGNDLKKVKLNGTDSTVNGQRKEYMKRIVFIVFVAWGRPVGETRTARDEYEQARERLPEGTGFYLGCRVWGREEGLRYFAVVKLGGQLATVGELCTWLDLGERWQVREPRVGQGLAKFVESAQSYCAWCSGWQPRGSRIVLEQGDVERMEMVTGRCIF